MAVHPLVKRFYPESAILGYTFVDGTNVFYNSIRRLIGQNADEKVLLDLGCGRGAYIQQDGEVADYVIQVRNFKGKEYLLEYAFDADFALVKAWKGDTQGNLVFHETARNFNPLMAMAGKITIAEVEELLPAGHLHPDHIHTPGIFVHRIFQGENYEKRIEQRTVRKRDA